MAAAFVQKTAEGVVVANSTSELTLTGVTAGRLLVAVVLGGTASRTWSISDSVNGAWTLGPALAHTVGWSAILYKENCGSGDTVITATISSSTGNMRWMAIEVSGAATSSALEASDTYDEPSTVNDHVCSSAGINATAGSIIFSCSRCNSTFTAATKGANYVDLVCGATNIELSQYRETAGALTSEQAPWSNTGTARDARSAMAVFAAAAGGTAVKDIISMGIIPFAR